MKAELPAVTLPGGRQVPALGLGTWHMGEGYASPEEEAASLRAGLSPMLLPLHGNELELLRLIESSEAVMAIGVSRVGTLRPLSQDQRDVAEDRLA